MTDGVVETPHGAHFTECVPDYPRDEAFQKRVRREREERRGVGRVPGQVRRRDRSRVPEGGVGVSDSRRAADPRRGVRGRARRVLPRRRRDPRQPDRHAADDRRPAGQGDVRARARDDRRRGAARREHHAGRRRRAREGRRRVEPVPHDVRRRVVGPPPRDDGRRARSTSTATRTSRSSARTQQPQDAAARHARRARQHDQRHDVVLDPEPHDAGVRARRSTS